MALIELRNIDMRFPVKRGGSHGVFGGLQLRVDAGEFVTVVGQTGCGKSTLLRLILGSERACAGEVLVRGRRVTCPGPDRGYVPQKYSLFPDKTVLQNISFGPMAEHFRLHRLLRPAWWEQRRAIERESLEYLALVGLREQDAQKYPDQLSGGMQQRVAIAQALILRPPILLMDEAFSALDPGTRAGMQRMTRALWQETGTTVVFVTHNMNEAVYLGSRVILLARNEQAGVSEIALDVAVPETMRKADGQPRAAELAELLERLEAAARPGSERAPCAPEDMAEVPDSVL